MLASDYMFVFEHVCVCVWFHDMYVHLSVTKWHFVLASDYMYVFEHVCVCVCVCGFMICMCS